MSRLPLITALLLAALMSLVLTACGPSGDRDLQDLVTMMTGSFSSAAQAETDTTFFDIRLEMTPIWADQTEPGDGHYLYVEQAGAWALDKPYRQRVYHVARGKDDMFVSMVYALPDPAAAVGAWKLANPLAYLTPADLVERDGCAVYMKRLPDGSFVGSTREKECTSQLRGAAYATSEITITADKVVSWDRGWDENDAQVWGAEISGYIFDRVK